MKLHTRLPNEMHWIRSVTASALWVIIRPLGDEPGSHLNVTP